MRHQFTPLLFVNMNNVDPILIMDLAQEAGLETFVSSVKVSVYKEEEIFAMGFINPPGTTNRDLDDLVFEILQDSAPGYTCFFMDNEGMIQQADIKAFDDNPGVLHIAWNQVAEVWPTPTDFGTLKAAGRQYGINLNLTGGS